MAKLFSYFYSKTLWFAQKVRTVFKHMVVNSGLIVVDDYITGWWFKTFFFPFSWEFFMIPTDELHDFSEGWLNHQLVLLQLYD